MQSTPHLNALPDGELLHRLLALLRDSRRTEAELVAHIAEVDARRLYLRQASPSMFQYCTDQLHLSGPEAYLRIAAARISREHPVVLTMLADGRLHLTAIALLGPCLTPANRDVVLERATHKTKREVEEIVAEIVPRPDAPAFIRKLPAGWGTRAPGPPALPPIELSAAPPGNRPCSRPDESTPASSPAQVAISPALATQVASLRTGLRPDGVRSGALAVLVASASEPGASTVAGRDAKRSQEFVPAGSEHGAGTRSSRSTIEPLAPARYKVQFTASAELRDKLQRLRELMWSSVPDGDLAVIIEAAVSEKLERLESRRFGRSKAPRKAPPKIRTRPAPQSGRQPVSRYLPADLRRGVHERDEGRCRYVDGQGRRCTARTNVEFHHRRPFGMGGEHSPANLSLLCRGHNRLMAEVDYGRAAIAGSLPHHAKPSS